MLERLLIKNVALIEQADIRFDGAYNVLSGETGAGKSVILDSINFVLGSKADKSMIRYGTEEASVRAEFSVDGDNSVLGILQEMDIESDGEVIISRRFSCDGKSAIKINGNSVTASMLKRVAAHLVDVHGQSEHFFLLNEVNQLSVIDCLCVQSAEYKSAISALLTKKKELKSRISKLGGSEQERAQRLDILSYQIKEIEAADVKVGEYEQLKAKKRVFDNAERIIGSINAVKGLLCDDNGCIDLLSMALRQAACISDVGEEYEKLYSRLDDLSVEAQDISESVTDIADGLNFDANQAKAIEDRLDLIKSLCKKYGGDEQAVCDFLADAKSQYELISDASAELEKINAEILECDGKIYELCQKLTSARKQASGEFCNEVVKELKSLNIPNATFFVDFAPYDDRTVFVTSTGADSITFMFSANRGEPAKPLSKVISGGEMSRFMLAIKTVLKDINGISTYVFDEIDAGISGVTALSVADKFISISKNTQIIAVSHLPQVCAAATSQFLIYKVDEGGKTVTRVKKLTEDERVDEIVRLTGSIVTDAARVHASELLKRYK